MSDLIINPDNEKPGPNNFYSEEIANRLPEYFLIVIIIASSVTVISFLLMFPKIDDTKDENLKKLEYLIVIERIFNFLEQ